MFCAHKSAHQSVKVILEERDLVLLLVHEFYLVLPMMDWWFLRRLKTLVFIGAFLPCKYNVIYYFRIYYLVYYTCFSLSEMDRTLWLCCLVTILPFFSRCCPQCFTLISGSMCIFLCSFALNDQITNTLYSILFNKVYLFLQICLIQYYEADYFTSTIFKAPHISSQVLQIGSVSHFSANSLTFWSL